MIRRALSTTAVGLLAAASLAAQSSPPGVQAFESGSYEAQPTIVASGDISTSPWADANRNNRGVGYDGVVSLAINTPGGTYICSGSLLWTGLDVLTAGHCPSAGGGATSIDAVFFPGPTGNNAEIDVVHTTRWDIHPGYNPAGSAIQGTDLAVIHLPGLAPAGATRYSLYGGDPINDPNAAPKIFDVVGFGMRSSGGLGTTVNNADFFVRRHGYNVFDFRFGDFFGAQYDSILMADFDSGLAANDAGCVWFGVCQPGVFGEAITAGGDSGGPAFIDGQIAGVTSFGVRFKSGGNPTGTPPDIDASLNSSFGEMAGWVQPDRAWITSVAAPEPSTYVLFGTGLGMLGLVARRRRRR